MKTIWQAQEREEVYFPHPSDPDLFFSVTLKDGRLEIVGRHLTKGPVAIEAVTLAPEALYIQLP